MRTQRVGVMLFFGVFVVLVLFAFPAYTILHGETTIPQLQRYTDPFPWQKSGLSVMLLTFSFMVLFLPFLYDRFRSCLRIPWYGGRYKIRVEGRWLRAKLLIDRMEND